MKLIHTADQHLDSKLSANLNKEKAKERKGELLKTFLNMVKYAVENGIEAILLSGDLFDTKTVAATERRAVESVIRDNKDIMFFYLKGNHDENSFLASLDDVPENLKLFGTSWTSYNLSEKIVVTGLELSADNKNSIYNTLTLNPEKFNIVMLHGQENEYDAKDKAEVIAIRELRGKNIDYLALGHVHEYKMDILDSRGKWCYPGCLEGRGFDECGDHGFVVVDIDENKGEAKYDFVSFASRRLHEVEVDVSGEDNSYGVIKKIDAVFSENEYSKKDLIKIILKGNVELESERDLAYICKNYEDDFYFVKIYDETRTKVDYNSFALDESLKGEFVRTVMDRSDLDEDQKARVIKLGIEMLRGEKV